MPQNRPRIIYVFLAFLLLTVIAYWQIALLQNSLKWDMLGCYLPWRYHVGECLQSGVFPFWNPYTHYGYPIHADLRSVWYPETFLIGLTTGYSYLTLHLLFVVHLALAGLGMYLLSTHFTSDWRASFVAGAAYVMSGFFVGHGQEMFGIIAATWIPFVLFYFIRLQQNLDFRDILRTTIFAFLLVTGGYQAMWAILIYLLAAIFIAIFIRYFRQQQYRKAWRLVWLNTLLTLVTAFSLSVIAVTFLQVAPYIGRLGGLSLEDAWFMPFSPRSAISFLLPFATVKDLDWYATDVSMNNAYAGLIVLIFLILSFFRKQTLLFYVILLFGLISLLAAFGEFTPIRAALYHGFPLLNLFRHSSFFSYFTVLAFILGGAVGIGNYLSDSDRYRKPLIGITLFLTLIITGLFIYAIKDVNLKSFSFFEPAADFSTWLTLASRHEHILVHALIQLIVLIIFFYMIKKRRHKISLMLPWLVFMEMFIAVQLNIYYTVASAGVNPVDLSESVQQRPDGFPLPQIQSTVAMNSERNTGFSVLWRNASIYTKTVSAEGYNSFRLNNYDYLMDSLYKLSGTVQQNSIIYLSEEVYPFSVIDSVDYENRTRVLFVKDADFIEAFSQLHISPGDSVRMVSFYPGYARVEVNNQAPVALTLLQAMYPGWSVKVDDKPAEILLTNHLFISVIMPPGSHTVEFSYHNNLVMTGFLISYTAFFVLISLIVWFGLPLHRRKTRYGLLFVMWLLVGLLFLFRFYTSYEYTKQQAYHRAANALKQSGVNSILLNVDDVVLMDKSLKGAGFAGRAFYANLTYDYGLSHWLDLVDSLSDSRVGVLNLYAGERPEAVAAIRQKWPIMEKEAQFKSGNMQISIAGEQPEGFSSLNDFEAGYPGWSGDFKRLSDSVSLSGKFSNKIDSLHPGSFVYRWEVTEKEENIPFEVFVRAKVKGNFENSALIILQRRGEKVIRSFSAGSRTYQITDRKWTNVAKLGAFPKGAVAGDVIQVFFWSSKSADFYIDDFWVLGNL